MEQLTVKRPSPEHHHFEARDIDAEHRRSFTFALTNAPATVVVRLDGELDLACENDFSRLRATLAEQRPPRVVVDAGGVTFIDCAGYGLLVALSRTVRDGGASFVLNNPSRAVSRLMSLWCGRGPALPG